MVPKVLIGCVLVVATSGGIVLPLWADTLKLKDGAHLDGKVMDAGTGYWVKLADGSSRTVPKDSVQEWVRGDAGATPASASAGSLAGRGQAAALPGGAPFAAVKAKADRVDTPIQAVGLWQSFIDTHPSAADAAAAKQQLAYWNQLMNGNAERINGKWIWGAERDKLLAQVRDLMEQAAEDMRANQTLKGLREYEQAVKLYPNDFEGNFWMGRINLEQGAAARNNAKIDAGIKSLETAVKLRPNSAPALSNLAIAYNFRAKYLLSIQTAYQAAKLEDNKGIVQNLITVIDHAPTGLRNNDKVKPIIADAMVLAGKYGISNGGEWYWVDLEDESDSGDGKPSHSKGHHGTEHDDSDQKGPPGIIGNGTGELVSADGYILTNRHVAKEGDYLMVRLSDGTIKVADRVVIDDEQDLAVLKIKTDVKLPFVRLAGYDHPPVGADVDVFGFPLLGMVGAIDSSVKMTRGIVTAWDEKGGFDNCDVTVDATINPGNSGGPIVDHNGNLLAVATAKTGSGDIGGNQFVGSYGLGQSTGHIRRFLAHQAAKLGDLKVKSGTADKQLTNEELATKLTPVTVCIFVCRGAPPADGAVPKPPAQP